MRLAPPLSNGEAPPPDDVESLLRAYFRAEMTDPWPAPPLALVAQPEPSSLPTLLASNRSRLALAASVALLVAGTLIVSGRTPISDKPVDLPGMLPGEATHYRVIETLVQPKDKPTELRIQVTEDVPAAK